MARQRGILRIEGTMSGMTFYKMGNAYFIKAQREISRDRILHDPKFKRVMENANEFGSAANAGKLLRDTVKRMMKNAPDVTVTQRLTQLMTKIVKSDTINARGLRNVGTAILQLAAKNLLKGFEFNINSPIERILLKRYDVNVFTGEITINHLVPVNDLVFPEAATSLVIRGAFAVVNFTTKTHAIEYTNEVHLTTGTAPTTIVLTPAGIPAGSGTKIYLLQIEFFDEVNGLQYELNNKAFNAIVMAEVA
jgi:hypothetical protein